MPTTGRRGVTIFFLIFGISLVALTVALNVGWILLNLQQIALLVMGMIFFAAIITGLVLNTIFLIREIKRNEQHDAFLNAVTHELKTPIASIRLYLDTLKSRDVPEEKKREFYDIMLNDSDRLLNTVELVLQASRTRDSKRILNTSEINIASLLEECIQRISNRYSLPPDAITLAAEKDVTINGDRAELQIAFANLLDNAVKYSDKDVKVSVEIDASDEKDLEVSIQDSGAGMDAGELKRIFRRFYRIPNISTQNAKGTGLGLSIVSAIIERHGGKINAESKGVGHGSKFIVKLPKI